MRLLLAVVAFAATVAQAAPIPPDRASVIFVHPDGAGAATWAAARNLYVGPDDDLHWDRLPDIALYRGHARDSLTPTSNAGATMHAFGLKTDRSSFGFDRTGGSEPVDAEGRSLSVAKQAIAAGIPVGLVQSGSAIEPGTAAFVASVDRRGDFEDITRLMLESGTDVMFSGGEEWFLPEGVEGVHAIGRRTDGRNLIEEARELGYIVVRTRDELAALPDDATKVLGLFCEHHTFNDKSEETLFAEGLPNFDEEAPTIAEMTAAAIKILSRDGRQFFLIVEEEGSDNFGNNNNANGTLESVKRADDAIGVCLAHLSKNPQTLVITTADSDGGGLRTIGVPDDVTTLPGREYNGSPIDGVAGTGSAPFVSMPDSAGRRHKFAITWAARGDVSGGVLVRAAGYNSGLVRGSMDNTEVGRLMRRTLFAGTPPTTQPVAE